MKNIKPFLIALAVLLGTCYYMYLTNVHRLFQISDTYYVGDEYSSIVMKFDENTLSSYIINPNTDTIAIRVDYYVGYRKYNEDIIGNFWSDKGLETLSLRGSDIAGRMSAECIGCTVWSIDGEMYSYDEKDIEDMEKENKESYSFKSRFSIDDNVLRIYNYLDIDLENVKALPDVESEIVRLMDSLYPPKFS